MGEQELLIEERYRGPPDSGNGGYVCGLVAGFLGAPAEVTLRRPPPIGRALLVRQLGEGGVALLDNDEVVAEGLSARVEVEAPEAVGFRDAAAATQRYSGFVLHPFPACFVCGPERAEGDGLRIFPGPVVGRQVVAAPWTPGQTLAGVDGLVRPEFVWAALDCPGAFANGFPEITMVLGRLAVQLVRPVEPGTECVVVGWSEAVEGRKHFAGTALFAADGELRAVARATWIRVTPSNS
ncbi:MAG TPA: hotdog fold domain-containing protein [Actinomycetota bacterium]|nr:hotdog fold domain-containing protein [Actinomycetota bacterium]